MTSILVVEDDEAIRTACRRGLDERGYAVATAATGLGGLELLINTGADVVLLDLGLPDVDGLALISMIRALDSGADDYVVKPFGTDQLAARIRAVLRRSGGSEGPPAPVRVGELLIDERARTATLAGESLELARKEFDLLLALASRPGEVVTKRELLAEVWRDAYGGSERTVDVHLSWLRRKLGESAAEPRYLHSVRGVGVRLVDPGEQG